MPSADTVCIYGDSHIGSVKFALDKGLLPELEGRIGFWGAPGPEFRGLRMKQGRIVPDESVVKTLAKVRGDGPETLGPKDFGTFVFYAARMQIGEFLKSIHDHAAAVGPVSDAVLHRMVRDWLSSIRAYRFARSFGKAGARVVFVPVSLPTAGVLPPEREAERFHAAPDAPAVQRTREMITALSEADGVSIVFQPDETINDAMMTRRDYGIRQAEEAKDTVHKSPEFAAMMVRLALDRVAQFARAA